MDEQDEKFLEKLREKQEEVAKLFFEHFYHPVFKAAYFITRDNHLAEDVVQETFLAAINNFQQLKDEAKINAWLIQIALNTARSLLRKTRWLSVLGEADMVHHQVRKYLPEDLVIEKEDLRAIWNFVEELPVEVQRVFILRYQYDMSIKEISHATDLPEGTVKSHLSRGRLYLRKKLCSYNAGATVKKPECDSSLNKGVSRI